MVHNTFFVIHIVLLEFLFWCLVVNFSKSGEEGFAGMVERTFNVFRKQGDDMHYVIRMMCRLDWWLVIVYELLDLWLSL
eukprot:gene45003-23558_t